MHPVVQGNCQVSVCIIHPTYACMALGDWWLQQQHETVATCGCGGAAGSEKCAGWRPASWH